MENNKIYFKDSIFHTEIVNKIDYIVIRQNDKIGEELNTVVISNDILEVLKNIELRK